MRLNELLNIHKIKKMGEDEKPEKTSISNQSWTNSNLLLMFLENTINKYSRKPTFDENRTPISYEPAI